MREMGSKDSEIITYDQAHKYGAGIKKGSPKFNLTTYDTEKKVHGVNTYYPLSAVYNSDKLPKLEQNPAYPGMKIVCEETNPEKYLGKFLAATALNARFETTKEIQDAFKQNLIADLEKSIFGEKTHPCVRTRKQSESRLPGNVERRIHKASHSGTNTGQARIYEKQQTRTTQSGQRGNICRRNRQKSIVSYGSQTV